ncbi:hypothetical protein [Phenylobacterium sp.]|uniref:hypothetical protein n=1 Tax=Phenylobacterium sp. TaxID=1871053 RepID=UPI002FDC8475
MTPRAVIIPFFLAAFQLTAPGLALAETPPEDPLRFPVAGGSVKFDIEIGAQAVTEKDAFWNLSDSFAPGSGFAPDMTFGEAYLKSGAVFTRSAGAAKLEAGLSFVASQTLGEDVFASRDQGDIKLENAYASLDLAVGSKMRFRVSGGAQPYRVGSGMLIADGAADGFERGALIFGPRQAFEQTVLARLQFGEVSVEGFHLDARELPSSDSRTVVEGLRVDVSKGQAGYLGLAYGRVPESEAPYVQAAPGGLGAAAIIANGRDGLTFWNGYFKVAPLSRLPTLWVAGDYAVQHNDRINMRASGGRFEIGNAFNSAPMTPTLSYSYQVFSGDNPNTAKLERFDPLFYDGGQNGWASGTNGAFVFINSNIRAHKVTLVTLPSPQDIVTLRYAKVSADRLRSPIQFGQGTRPMLGPGGVALVTGVTSRPLSDDILIEYTRVVSPNIYLSAGLGHSWIGRGQAEAASAPTKDWTGAFANIVFRY